MRCSTKWTGAGAGSNGLRFADVPGATEDTVSVELDRGELRIEAGRFRRGFVVPDGIDADHVKAELKNGVLQLRLPKSADVRPRRVSVRAA